MPLLSRKGFTIDSPQRLIHLGFLLSFFILGSCTKNDNKVLPQLNIPKHFPAQTASYRPVKQLPYTRWWAQFHDTKLNQYIAQGLERNLDMHIAFDNLQKAQGQLNEVELSWFPTIKTFAGYSTNPALGIPGGFYGVWPTYAINILQLFQQQKRARYSVEYYQAMVEGTRLTVIGQIASAYITLIAQQEQLRLLKRLEKHVAELVGFSRKDIKIGLKNEIDLADIQVDKSLVDSQINIVENNIVRSQNALRFLLNENPGRISSKNNFSAINFTKFKPGSLPVSVLNNRPDIKMATYAAKAARVDVSLARSEFFPLLQLDQFIGEGHLPHNQIANVSDAYFNWSVAPSTLGRISSQKAAFKASVHEYIKTVRKVLRDVDNSYSANRKLNNYYLAVKKAENEYRHQFNLQKGLLNTGLISYKQLLENEITLDNLALSSNQAKLELALSLVLLYQDLAGGYKA